MASATDAPTPTLFVVTPSLEVAGSAFVVVDDVEAAVSETFPAVVAAPSILAEVFNVTIEIATEPATPTSPAPAPEVASASNVCVLSAPTAVIDAASATDAALTEAPVSMTASFVTFAYKTETATPMPTPEVSLLSPLGKAAAEPSDFAVASVFAELVSENAPPAVTVAPLST
jgi:nucleoid-associated protein YgaU